ncbi:MAG: homoserine O-succinyltransferase [Firmicutes bacterium]|nr:homoserine O-succinyltransferase [Bacillota bacterium]
MPVRINEKMPVVQRLLNENIFVMTEYRAAHQDIRPLQIAILNIMPEKESAELQMLRLLSNTALQVEITFIRLDSHTYKNASAEYLNAFYKPFAEVRKHNYDGLIVTGAPVENLAFEEVDYWKELKEIMEWSRLHVTSTMYICWAAQAGLYYFYGIPKYRFDKKLSGVYPHRALKYGMNLTRGFDDVFYAPHSRYTGVRKEDVLAHTELTILADSEQAGAYIILDQGTSRIFITGHPEYSLETLSNEYRRDLAKGINPQIPENYFPNNDPSQKPLMTWRCHSNLLFSNWLNYYVYQETPYDFS